MDQELMKKVENKEITIELLNELKIRSIEDYNKVIIDEKNNQEKKKKEKKKKEKKSKSQIKSEIRRQQHSLSKKIKSQNRNIILESLAKHKQSQDKVTQKAKEIVLKSKRKISKELEFDNKNEENNRNSESEDEEDSESSEDNVEKNGNENKILENEKNNFQTNEHSLESTVIQDTNKDHWNVLTPELRERVLKEIREHNKKNNLNEDPIEDEGIMDLEIPPKTDNILVSRVENLQKSRLELPIIKYESEIMDKINHSLVTIICGETGSGKSTQIPQFIYEYGYTKSFGYIAITQPRRIAAVSLSKRVSEELNLEFGSQVGYHIRYDALNCKQDTLIKFMTDGILLKEIESDSFLLKYSVVVIDEAHERSINTDILIGLLSKIINYRYVLAKAKVKLQGKEVKPLRLVIMSATLRVDEFFNDKIFKQKPSFIKVEARQFPVSVHHLKRTPEFYFDETFKIVCKIHKKFPKGGILVFLTGKKEINDFIEMLKKEFERKGKKSETNEITIDETNINDHAEKLVDENDEEKKEIIEDNEDVDPEKFEKIYQEAIILPLYSSLEQSKQNQVFELQGEEKRMIIVSTNVAETSITIPGIKYVVDSGMEKKRILNQGLSFSTFKIEYISQASAMQRTGRAGRTGPGHCYRIYSSGLFSKMNKFNEPQILSAPLDQMILYLKFLKIKDINNFPFLSFPEATQVEKTIRHLIILKAIEIQGEENIRKKYIDTKQLNFKDDTSINDLGILISKFPLSPKYAKMLILGNKFNLLNYSIFLVSVFSQESIFMNQHNTNIKKTIDQSLINATSDPITYMNIIIFLSNIYNTGDKEKYKFYLDKFNINTKVIREIFEMINQLVRISKIVFKIDENDEKLKKIFKYLEIPSIHQQNLLIQVLVSGLIENIARRIIMMETKDDPKNGKVVKKKTIYECNENNEECQLSKSSVVEGSDYICYKEIIKEDKANLISNTIVQPQWLYNLGGELIECNFEKFVKDPFYLENKIYCGVDIKYGYKNWLLQNVMVEMKKDDDNYYRWFARFILEGKVLPKFRELLRFYSEKPEIITNKLTLDEKVLGLVSILKTNSIHNKTKLVERLKTEKSFLFKYIKLWVKNKPLNINDWINLVN